MQANDLRTKTNTKIQKLKNTFHESSNIAIDEAKAFLRLVY